MGPARTKSDYPSLGERRTFALYPAGSPEVLVVGRRVGKLEARPVDRDEPAAREEAPRRARLCQGLSHLVEERRQRFRAETVASVADCRLVGETHRVLLALGPGEAVRDEGEHILIGTVGVQRHAHREVGDRARWKRTPPLLGATAARDHRVDHLRGEDLGEHADRHRVGEAAVRVGLSPTGAGHAPKLHRCHLN